MQPNQTDTETVQQTEGGGTVASSALLGRLVALRDNAYLSYISACRETECLGEEAKIERCEFGAPELKAHRKASDWLGQHRAYARVVQMLCLPNVELVRLKPLSAFIALGVAWLAVRMEEKIVEIITED